MIGRYRRLSIWNKLAFWGGIASILGVAISLFPKQTDSDITTIKQETRGDMSPAIQGVQRNVNIHNESTAY